jgi:hypothetical protein
MADRRDPAWTTELPTEGFWLAVTAHQEPGDPSFASIPVARFVLEADGQLRAAVGPGADETVFPPPIRRLSREQLTAVWSQIAAIDSLNTSPHSRISDALAPGQTRPSSIRITAAGDGRQRARSFQSQDVDAASATKLVNQLTDLAWMSPASISQSPAK